MSKDLSKVKAGDFVKSGFDYGLVIETSNGQLIVIYEKGWDSVLSKFEYRRLKTSEHIYQSSFHPKNWKRAFQEAEPIFPKIEIDIRINGKQANLSDISEETLMKLRKNN